MELYNWRTLCDRGTDLVLCLDFPGGRATAGFAELAATTPAPACFLHIRQSGSLPRTAIDGMLDEHLDRWVAEALGTHRPVRAVLGYCAGSALATCVADAVAAVGPPPAVMLFDAATVAGKALCDQFTIAVEASAEHLADGELDGAREFSAGLLDTHPDDLPRIAAGLADRYDQLMAGLAHRLGLNEVFRRELTAGFTAYLAYLLLASQGKLELRNGTPLFVSSPDHKPPVEGAETLTLDVDRADLLRDAEVAKLVASVLSPT